MFGIIKESFKLTNKYIVLATPLILFSLLSSLYLLLSAGGKVIGLLIAVILFFLMLGAFLSGWFFMLKRAVNKDTADNPDELITKFPEGVGEYFLSVLGMILNIIIIFIVLGFISYAAGMKFIGNIGITSQQLSYAMNSPENLKAFLSGLSDTQLIKLNSWNILLFVNMLVSYFLMIFYAPALVYKNKNPFISLFISFKDIFSYKFFKNVGLFLTVFVSYFILSIATGLFGRNMFMHFIFTLINFYYITFIAILIFNYYYKNFVIIGSNIDEKV